MKILFSLGLFFSALFAHSQSYGLPAAGTYVGWNIGLKMDGITVEPTRLIVHAVFHDKYQTSTHENPQSLVLSIPGISTTYPITSITGAGGFGSYTMKFGKRYAFDFICPLNWNDLIHDADNPLFVVDILNMQLTTNPEFKASTPAWDSQDWRLDFLAPLTIEQQLTLGCAAYLSKLAVKGEFETTAAYNARMQTDSVKPKIMLELVRLFDVVSRPDAVQLSKIRPDMSYNADAETFTLDYKTKMAQPVKIKIPLSRAKELKEGYASGRFSISLSSVEMLKDGNYFIRAVSIYDRDKKKSEIFTNLLATGEVNMQWLADKIFTELSKKHPNGKLLK